MNLDVIFVFVILAVFFLLFISRMKKNGGTRSRFLCDHCKYDYDRACNNPRRPNATTCRTYRRRN